MLGYTGYRGVKVTKKHSSIWQHGQKKLANSFLMGVVTKKVSSLALFNGHQVAMLVVAMIAEVQ